MNKQALSNHEFPDFAPISPRREIGAYEALFLEPGATFKRLAERFASDPTALPSDFVPPQDVDNADRRVMKKLHNADVTQFGVRINKAGDYPEKLRHAKYPVEMLYFQGT